MILLKSIIYRIIRILLLLIVSLVILGDVSSALSISLIDAFIATIYYYYFDKFWIKIERALKELNIRWKYRKFNSK